MLDIGNVRPSIRYSSSERIFCAILNETSLGTVLSKMGYHVLDKSHKPVDAPTAELLRTQTATRHAHILHKGFGGALYEKEDGVQVIVLVLRGLGQKEIREQIAAAFATLEKLGEAPANLPPMDIRGRQMFRFSLSDLKTKGDHKHAPANDGGGSEEATCWFEDTDLVVVSTLMRSLSGETARRRPLPDLNRVATDSVLDTIEGN